MQLLGTMILSRRLLRPSDLRLQSAACLICQWRSFSVSYQRLTEKGVPATPQAASKEAPPPDAPKLAPAPVPSPLADAPRSYGKAVEEFTPRPLSRPIGLPTPPSPGDNAGIDTRTWKQRRDDFVDYDKHLIRRKEL
jgi:ATPase complex subunit ATP10